MAISLDLIDSALCCALKKPRDDARGISMFVSRSTFVQIRMAVMISSVFAPPPLLLNPMTGRRAMPYCGAYIEPRRWMADGQMMLHRSGFNLGETRIFA